MPRDTWTNWAATATANPGTTARPRDAEEVAVLLMNAQHRGQRVRPLGNGHSFTGIGTPETAGIALDLSHCSGIVRADRETGLVTVRAGTQLHQLNRELDELGLAMPNLGDIDQQTISGAISTGTHGTGSALGGLATQVEALELVLADGSFRSCSATESPELFNAARVGLGALGVLHTVTLRCVQAFALAADERPEPLDGVLESFDERVDSNDHFEFYWFPHSSNTLVKRNNRLPAGTEPKPLGRLRSYFEYEVMENLAFNGLCRLGRAVPALVRPLNRFASSTWSTRSYSDRAHRVFTTRRGVRFVECEYAIPRESLAAVLGELRAAVDRSEHPIMFPVEVRVAAADDIWMSTAYRRPTAYIAIHQFAGMPYRHWFSMFESIVNNVAGRPHWGKMHSLGADELCMRYPRFDDFARVRSAVDPRGTFRNPYLERVLGTGYR